MEFYLHSSQNLRLTNEFAKERSAMLCDAMRKYPKGTFDVNTKANSRSPLVFLPLFKKLGNPP